MLIRYSLDCLEGQFVPSQSTATSVQILKPNMSKVYSSNDYKTFAQKTQFRQKVLLKLKNGSLQYVPVALAKRMIAQKSAVILSY